MKDLPPKPKPSDGSAGCGCALILLGPMLIMVMAGLFALGFVLADRTAAPSVHPDPGPIVAGLQAEIEAREAELDALADALATTAAERDAAIARLRQFHGL